MQPLGKHSQRLKDLRRRIRRRVDGEVIVDGARLVDDLIRWRVPVRELYVSQIKVEAGWLNAATDVFQVNDEVLSGLAPTRKPQGVLAVVAEPRWPEWVPQGMALYLDGIQDPGNVGAIVRSAAALGAEAVLLGPACADPFGPAAVRGSAGAVFRCPVVRDVNIETAAAAIRSAHGEVWSTGSNGLQAGRWKPVKPLLLLLGTEGSGLSDSARNLADGTVTIPLRLEIESLNVAVAAGILVRHAIETAS